MKFKPSNLIYDLESFLNETEPLLKISDRMKRVNKLCEINGEIREIESSKVWYEVLLEDMNVSERELDLMFLAQNFVFARRCILSYLYDKTIRPYDAMIVNKVYEVLVKYNMQHTLLGDLEVKEFNKVMKVTKKYI